MGIIGILAVAFVGMTLINRVMAGQLITSTDVSILNQITIVKKAEIGFFTVPVPNLDFFKGIQHLVLWDYSFFGGNAQIILYFLYAFTFVVAFMLFTIIIGLLFSVIRSR